MSKWIKDVEELASIAGDNPQAALCALNAAVCKRWKYTQRIMGDISELFLPLEEVISTKFVRAVCGRRLSDVERKIISLPYRYGGLSIDNPVASSDVEYTCSKIISSKLVECIQSQNLDSIPSEQEKKRAKQEAKVVREASVKLLYDTICGEVSDEMKKLMSSAQEKGASSWLSCLPVDKLGFSLNKQEFQDALSLRYNWPINGMPKHCACGEVNNIDHTLICKKGGYVAMRHNQLRDTEAFLMKEVARDVTIEPVLLPVNNAVFQQGIHQIMPDWTYPQGAYGVVQRRHSLMFE